MTLSRRVAPLLALLLVSPALAAISNCSRHDTAWHSKENHCVCGHPSCGSGWSLAVHTRCCDIFGCKQLCDKDGCKRQVCNECSTGYYKSGFSRGHATACSKCSDITGCTVTETCTTKDNAQCSSCSKGRYLKHSSGFIKSDSCPECTAIPNCANGRLTCSSSTSQQCESCNVGYYPSSDKRACEKCKEGCHSCGSHTLERRSGKCLACASDWVESNDRSKCIKSCPSGQYPTGYSSSGGKLYCAVCPAIAGCAVGPHCSQDGTGSHCPSGNCLPSYYAREDKLCYPREKQPSLGLSGPFVTVEEDASFFYSFGQELTWVAQLQQMGDSNVKSASLSPSAGGLGLEWKDFAGQITKERSFRLQVRKTQNSNGMFWESHWSEHFSFTCDCNGREGKDGELGVEIVQDRSAVRFLINYYSYCANGYIVERNVGQGFELIEDWTSSPMDCNKPDDNTKSDDLAINNQVTASIGKEIMYRFHAKNAAIGYNTVVEMPHLVQFWSVVRGSVKSQSIAGVQIPGVKITATVDPAFSTEPVVVSALTRPVNGNDVEYEILVQNSKISALSVPVIITATYPAEEPAWEYCSAANEICTCAGGLVGLTFSNGSDRLLKEDGQVTCSLAEFGDESTATTDKFHCECSDIQHRFDCPLAGDKCVISDTNAPTKQQTHHVEIDLLHTKTTEVTFFDMSTYTVGGKASIFDTKEHTDSGRPCGLEGVEVCPYEPDSDNRLPQPCAKTDVDGNYEIAVPVGTSLTLRPMYSNNTGAEYFTVPSLTLPAVFKNDLSHHFEYRKQSMVDILVGGGKCFFPIGTFNLKFTIDSCADYNRKEGWHTGKGPIYLGPADFTVRVDSFEPANDLNDDDITDGSVTAYLAKSNQQTKYINLFSRNDTHALVAEFTAESDYGHAEMDFMFRSMLQFEFIAQPGSTAPDCGGTTVAAQNSFGTVSTILFEEYGSSRCDDVSGNITVVDQVTDVDYICSGAEGCETEIELIEHPLTGANKSGVVVPLNPGEPNLFPDYMRSFHFYWSDPGRNGDCTGGKFCLSYPVLVTGQKKMGDSFSVTLSKGNPRTIIYDPPGGGSFAQLIEGSKLQSSFTMSVGWGFGMDSEIEILAGVNEKVDACAGGIVGSICKTMLELKIEAGAAVEAAVVDGWEESIDFTYSLDVENAVATSASEHLPGFYSDVLVLSALTVTFSRTRKLEVDATKCTADPTSIEDAINIYDTAVYRPALEGFAVKSFYDIELVEIPSVQKNMETLTGKLSRDGEYAQDDDGEQMKLKDQLLFKELNATLSNYERLISNHANRATSDKLISPESFFKDIACKGARGECTRLNDKACKDGDLTEVSCDNIDDGDLFDFGSNNNRIFFSGGGTEFSLSAETVTETFEGETDYYDMEELIGLKFKNEMTLGSAIIKTEAKLQARVEAHRKSGQETLDASAKTVEFTLSDPDVGDRFDVELFYDKEYGTPYFKTVAGRSSCPAEEGTVSRMKVKMDVEGLRTFEGIPEDEPFILPVDITNESPTDEQGVDYFILTYDQASNPNGLQISVDGSGLQERPVRNIPVGETMRVNVKFERPPGHFDFEDIKLQIIAACEIDLVQARNATGDDLTVSLHFQQTCSPVEFAGEIADYDTFTVTKAAKSSGDETIKVVAYDRDNFFTPWSSHPFLEDVRVEYRRLGDSIWNRARKSDGTFDNLKDRANSEGFAETFVDASKWEDGEYEMRLFSYCGNRPGPVGSFSSTFVTGRVDRVEPRIFGSFAEPADGIWSPGDKIAVRFNENIDCRPPYTFNAHVVIKDDDSQVVVNNDQLDLKCDDDTVEVAFSMYSLLYSVPELIGKDITVFVENSRDIAGNFQEDSVKWSFKVDGFDVKNAAVLLTLYFEDLSISDYTKDPTSFQKQVVSEACDLASCKDGQEPIVTDVREGSIWLDLEWPQDADSYSPVERFYKNLNTSAGAGDMLLSRAELKGLSYIETIAPQIEEPGKQSGEIGDDVPVETSSPKVGQIVGGIVGGFAAVALIVAGIWLARRKRSPQKHEEDCRSDEPVSMDSDASDASDDLKVATITNITAA
mmetsp:Transcript_46489/g.140840  ORF Transcript_46489/g.140840 Transcript_46489/m.140840 type:complete len:2055 (-) Transcript_46489:76-6240(-)